MKEMVASLVKEIFNEAETGIIKIDDWRFFSRFYTRINGKSNIDGDSEYPLFDISSFSALVDALCNYLTLAEKFYEENKTYYDLYDEMFYKRLLLDLFASAPRSALNDLVNYVGKKTEMLENNLKEGNFKLGEYEGIEIYGEIKKNRSYYESLYNMDIYFKKDNEIFYLPSINFSCIDNVCYLGSVQRKKDIEVNSLSKKLDRYFRKVNKGVNPDDIIANVSPNALIALTIFNAYLRKNGIVEIFADNYMPIRYFGYRDKLPYRKDIDIEKELERLELDQYNMTNKFLYLLLRYDYHFETGCDYDDLKDEMILYLSNGKEKDDNIIYNIDRCISEYNQNRRGNNGRNS